MDERPQHYLSTYLNDHLAGSTAGIELTKRIASAHEDEPLGRDLSALADEIDADRAALEAAMEALDVSPGHIKRALAWTGEKFARAKLNGHLVEQSPLRPLLELEALSLGIEGKRLLWISLAETKADAIGKERLDQLIERAVQQRTVVEAHREHRARVALGGAALTSTP